MTEEQLRNIDLDILNHLKNIEEGDKNNAILYMRGDVVNENAVLSIKGDVVLLANTFLHHMDKNQQFQQYILSVLGSWLAAHPEEEKRFLAGIETLRKNLGIDGSNSGMKIVK